MNTPIGADTTAAALSIGLHHLARQPALWRQLQEELKPLMKASPDSRPSLGDLSCLPFLSAVIKEGLRISCPIRGHMPRVVPAGGWTYGDFYFPAGVSDNVILQPEPQLAAPICQRLKPQL